MHAVATPLGYRADGRPVWPIAGGSDTPPATDPPTDPPADPPTDPAEPPTDPPAEPPSGEPSEPSPLEQQAQDAIEQLKRAGQEVPKALEDAVKEFRQARREAANYRTQSREQEQQQADAMKGLAKAFGLELKDDEPPNPEELQQQIQQSQDDARTARVELAAYRSASRHGADPDALLDSRTFLAKVDGLDPGADDFDEQLDAAVTASLEANPRLKATPGGRPNGTADQGVRGNDKTRDEQIRDAERQGDWQLAGRLKMAKLAEAAQRR